MTMKKNVLLLESVSGEAHQLLQDHARIYEASSPFSGGALADEVPVHAIITRGKGDVSADLIGRCPDLQVIARCGVGLDNVDVDFATGRGVRVLNAPGSNADTVAEHTLALMLALQRNLYHSIAAVRDHRWSFRTTYQGDEIRGKTLGILGMGNIGQKVAALAHAFGMRVVYWNARPQKLSYPALPREEVLRQSDLLSLHLPLTGQTRQLIDRAALDELPDHALLINTARGELIDQPALIEALQEGRIGGFAADVLAEEPPPADSPLLQLPNVLITPHSASLTARTYNEMCVTTVNNALALLTGQPIDERYIFNRRLLSDE